MVSRHISLIELLQHFTNEERLCLCKADFAIVGTSSAERNLISCDNSRLFSHGEYWYIFSIVVLKYNKMKRTVFRWSSRASVSNYHVTDIVSLSFFGSNRVKLFKIGLILSYRQIVNWMYRIGSHLTKSIQLFTHTVFSCLWHSPRQEFVWAPSVQVKQPRSSRS